MSSRISASTAPSEEIFDPMSEVSVRSLEAQRPSLLRTKRYQLRWKLRTVLGRYRFFLSLVRHRYADPEPSSEQALAEARVLSGPAEIVIEGFPRCGNTFAVTAFQLAQDEPVAMANHLHVPAQVIEAIRREIPTVLLIRDPVDTAISFVIQHNLLVPGRQVLEQYVDYYRTLEPYLHRVVVAPFSRLTNDLGAVIRRVNRRYEVDFTPFDHTDENESRCFEVIERENVRKHSGSVREVGVARPSELRDQLKRQLRERFDANGQSEARQAAYAVYRDVLAYSDVDG